MLRSFANGRLMGERFGSAQPRVLALHGWGRSHLDFTGVLSPPGAEPLDAIALDLPGFGSTPAPPDAWGSPEYAELVSQVLAEMATPVVVLGHSFGGRVAVEMAASRPDDVAALVLTGVPLLRPTEAAPRTPWAFRMGRALHRMGLLSAVRMEALRQRHGSSDYRSAEGVMRQVLVRVVNETYDEALAAIRCPVDLVWGADDDVARLEVARAVAERVPDTSVTAVPDAGHLTPLSIPAVLRSALVNRLETLQTG